MGIQRCTVCGRIKKPVLIKLALNFDTVIANVAQQPNRHGLIIDIGTGSPVRSHNTAYNKVFALKVDILIRKQRKNRMTLRQIKRCADAAFVTAMPDKATIGARAKCQSK